jgi:hypothetical protein
MSALFIVPETNPTTCVAQSQPVDYKKLNNGVKQRPIIGRLLS